MEDVTSVLGDTSRSRDRIESRGRSERASRRTLIKNLSERKKALIDIIKAKELDLSPERRKEEGARAPADQARHDGEVRALEDLKNRLEGIQIQIDNAHLLGTGIHPDMRDRYTGGGKRKTIRKRKASNRRRSSRK